MTQHYICATCGTQYPAGEQPPGHCPICEDERQYVGPGGQKWTTLDELRDGHHNIVKTIEPRLTGIGTHPDFASGQRALLVQTPAGNVLWDCITLLDEPTCAVVNALGGISAIAISHPHYYSSMVEWAHAFNAPVYLHAADRQWVMRPDPAVEFWDGETKELQRNVPRPRLGRVFGARSTLLTAGSPLGLAIGGALLAVAPSTSVIALSAAACILVGLGGLVSPAFRGLSLSPGRSMESEPRGSTIE